MATTRRREKPHRHITSNGRVLYVTSGEIRLLIKQLVTCNPVIGLKLYLHGHWRYIRDMFVLS